MTSMSLECNGRKAGETRTSAAYAIVKRLTPCHIISKKFFSKIFNCIKTENGSTPLPDGRTSQITCIFLKMLWHRTWTAGFVRRWQPVPHTHGVYIICINAEFGKTRQTAWCSVLTLIFNVSDGRNVDIRFWSAEETVTNESALVCWRPNEQCEKNWCACAENELMLFNYLSTARINTKEKRHF